MSTARAANYLISLGCNESHEALSRYAKLHPDRNNLGILANQLIENSPVSMSSTMREKNGLLFVVEFPPGSQLGCPDPLNTNIYESVLKGVPFRTSKIDLPLNPANTLTSILDNVSNLGQIIAVRQLVVASGGDFEKIRNSYETPAELIRHISECGFLLDESTSTYTLIENAE